MIEALKSIYDPEIPVDIYELGLIYDVAISEDGDAVVTMTLTTPALPVAERMPRSRDARAFGARHPRCRGEIGMGPAWDPSKMTDEARLELGML